ncbi:MAG: hypothetical protein C4551_07395 [Bacillota bacterium]|nr:MAG: hypothetical protein C4551_07395 [Bacillota bacterium]
MNDKRAAGAPGAGRPPRRRDRNEGEPDGPGHAEGDPETLVRVDSPDDVDLYRHDAPPPCFHRTEHEKDGTKLPGNRPRHTPRHSPWEISGDEEKH